MNFTVDELCRSQIAKAHGIDNTPPEYVIPAIRITIAGAERIRAFLKAPVLISSGFRCATLNALVGGASGSQHPRGEAIDFSAPQFGVPQAIVAALYPVMDVLGIDQLILEHGWVHASFTLNPRYQCLVQEGPGFRPIDPARDFRKP